jgi:oligoribonuclease NrnB/cAMP/cGMP phosphodiesterase (DHH superfamily)
MIVHHLSHIDLDGYFCQYLSTKKYKQVKYYNSNYGKGIYSNLKKIFKTASKDSLIFITDLNLEYKECEYIQKFVDKGYNVKLYDHHIAGEQFAKKYNWYYLDTSKSASLIFSEKENIFSELTSAVNSYDMWEESKSLELGCYLSEFINKEVLFYFNEEKIKFFIKHFNFIEQTKKEEYTIEYLEEIQINLIQKTLKEYKGTIKQRLAKKYTEEMFKQPIKNKYIFMYDIDREYFQYISQNLLKENDNLIIVLLSKNGRLSFRSKKEDVNTLAKIFFNGSGHINASGGSLGKNISSREEGIETFLDIIK